MAAAVAESGHADDDVGFDGRLPGQLAAHVHAHRVEEFVSQNAVRAGEVDVLEDAEGIALLLDGLGGVESLTIDDDGLARLHFAHEFGAEVVERAGLGGDDPAVAVEFADAERADAVWIAHGDEGVRR